MDNKLSHDSGQSLVLIALLLVGMIAFLGLVIDGGQIYVVRRNAQDSADSAAFAAVRKLALRNDDSATTATAISNTVTSFASENSAALPSDIVGYFIDQYGNNICKLPCTGVPSSPLATGVRVTVTIRYQPSFINLVIGNGAIPMPAVAAAQTGLPSGGTLLAPMALPFPCTYDPTNPDKCKLSYGTAYTLTGQSQLPGGFQWIDWSGGSSSTNLVDYLTLYHSGPIVLADPQDWCVPYTSPGPSCPASPPSSWIPSSSGLAINANVQTALNAWLDLSKWGTTGGGSVNWGTKPTDNKWIVPVFDTHYGTGSGAVYHVVMFGEFQLIGYWAGNGNDQCNWSGNTQKNTKCSKPSDLPSSPNPGWQLQQCLAANQACIMGAFLKDVTSLQIIPGKCNTNGVDICGIGLSQ